MPNCVQICKDAASHLTTPNTFLHGPQSFINLNDNNAVFPMIYLDEPLTLSPVMGKNFGGLRFIYNVKMYFANKSSIDWTMDQQQAVIQPLYQVMEEFINRVSKDSRVMNGSSSFNNITAAEFQNSLDVNTSGIWVEFPLEVINDLNNCTP